MNILSCAREVFDKEINALVVTKEYLNDSFVDIVYKIQECSGKVIITGMGKSGHIGKKIAATFSSLGTPAFFLDPAEAMHGDLGMVSRNDVVIMISHSGESNEIIEIIPGIKYIGAVLIGITGNNNSTLAKLTDLLYVFPHFEEACHLGLAPTSSTTTSLCLGDALAIVLSRLKGFKNTDFGIFHPAGALGKSLVYRVGDLMATGEEDSYVDECATLKDVVSELTIKKLGIVSIRNDHGNLKGVITTGDFGRQLAKGIDIYEQSVEQVMTKNPITVDRDKLAVDALNIMKEHSIYSLPVIENNKQVGTINMQRILKSGIVG